jgi:hypothetical protein
MIKNGQKRTETDLLKTFRDQYNHLEPFREVPRAFAKLMLKPQSSEKAPIATPKSPISFFKNGALRFLSLRNDKKTNQNGPKRPS